MKKTTDAIIFYKNTLAKTNNDWLKALCMVNINKLGMQYWNFEYKKKDYWNPVD